MKKYKLIKKYPGSPDLGSIYEQQPNSVFYRCGFQIIFKKHIENQEEHWEEVIEKDYEILSFISTNTNVGEKAGVIRIPKYEGYNVDDYLYNGESVKNGAYLIYSIKRLSDGEIFTIGDNVKAFDRIEIIKKFYQGMHNSQKHMLFWNLGYSINELVKVKLPLLTTEDNVEVVDGETIVYWLQFKSGMWFEYGSTPYYNISVTSGTYKAFSTVEARKQWLNKKYPKPLFTTEDGVDIFENDSFYTIDSNFEIQFLKNSNEDEVDNAWFNKEKAEEYILMNKKSLSPNDILKVWSDLSVHTTSSLIKNSTLMAAIITHLKNENNKK